jgi:hypothetical protein
MVNFLKRLQQSRMVNFLLFSPFLKKSESLCGHAGLACVVFVDSNRCRAQKEALRQDSQPKERLPPQAGCLCGLNYGTSVIKNSPGSFWGCHFFVTQAGY